MTAGGRPEPAGTGMFVGIDRAVFAAALAGRLRHAGVDASLTAVERCAAALGAVRSPTLDEAYWLCRLSFVADVRELRPFDAVFGAVFGVEFGRLPGQRGPSRQAASGEVRTAPPRRAEGTDALPPAPLPWATLPAATSIGDDPSGDESPDDELLLHERRPSLLDVDVDRPFDSLDEDELARVGELLESVVADWPQRRSRRRRTTRSGGPVALRRSVREAMHTGGDVVRLMHTERREQPRRVVVLLDVSASMEHYARAYLHLTRALAIAHRAEVFAFATRLSRITPSVRLRSAADAIEQVSDTVGDRFSGTRMATNIATLLHHRVWNTTVRGAVVVICSDGWDADDPVRLDRAMRRLSLLAHRIVWVNPRAAAAGFEPLAGGMAAALPHCDHFVAGNTARSMREVIGAISAA